MSRKITKYDFKKSKFIFWFVFLNISFVLRSQNSTGKALKIMSKMLKMQKITLISFVDYFLVISLWRIKFRFTKSV